MFRFERGTVVSGRGTSEFARGTFAWFSKKVESHGPSGSPAATSLQSIYHELVTFLN